MDKINNYIKAIQNSISVSKLTYDSWFAITGKKSGKYAQIQKKFPTHFNVSKHAYLNTLIVTLYMLLEKKKQTINIRQLFYCIRNERQFKKKDIEHLKEKISKSKVIWKKICILRNNQFAHSNYDLSMSGVFKKAKIKPIEFMEFIIQLEEIVNFISKKYNGNVHAFNLDTKYNTRQFMDSLIKTD